MKTKYDLMEESIVKDSHGDNYCDLASFDINKIQFSAEPAKYKLTSNDLIRFFDLVQQYYASFDCYFEEILLWLNELGDDLSNDDNFGKEIILIKQTDVENFYTNNLK